MSSEERKKFFHLEAGDVLDHFQVDAEKGLSREEVEKRRDEHGLNQLQKEEQRRWWNILLDQFKSIVILILAAAAAVAFATGRLPEGIAVAAVTVVNTALGFFTEFKAIRSMEALRQLGRHTTCVIREEETEDIAAEKLVPGDIVKLSDGELVPADIRLVETGGVRVNEAALTGESVPVNKSSKAVDEDSALHERTSMLYKGTSISEGEAIGVVTATAMATELGHIAKLTSEADEEATPLQQRLDQLGRRLAWITIGIAVAVALAGLAVGRKTVIMIETSIALGVAAIPEGLPIVATIALARGMWLMAKRNALINRLTAVETLGATSVIFTDKTGTLTENRMQLVKAVAPDKTYSVHKRKGAEGGWEETGGKRRAEEEGGESLMRLLRIGALCSNAKLGEDEEESHSGDPTEVALLQAAAEKDIGRQKLLGDMAEVREVAFDSETMMMATVHESSADEGEYYVAAKGAPLAVLEVCDQFWHNGETREMSEEDRSSWSQKADELAGEGLRLLALADKEMDDSESEVYEGLRFAGLAALEDPPRPEAKKSIIECQEAGIRVIMVTGDRPDTGQAIGRQVGLESEGGAAHGDELGEPDKLSESQRREMEKTNVFARVTPEQKLNLVKLYQDEGQIVAMTGDGVNDTPALKQADIGVAMGKKGTDAAKQVADMVLRDDKFPTIVAAVRQGRIIYANIRKSVMFMLCTNIAEVLTVATASLLQLPLPLKPLQILYLNVLTDVFPALALGVGVGGSHVMRRQPRGADESVLTRHHWAYIGGWSGVIAVIILSTLLSSLYLLGYDEQKAVTISFLTLGFTKLWFVLNLRDRNTPFWKNDITTNRWIWAAWAVCIVLLVVAVYFGPLAGVLQTTAPGGIGWTVILGASLIPALIGIFVPGIHFYSARNRHSEEEASDEKSRKR